MNRFVAALALTIAFTGAALAQSVLVIPTEGKVTAVVRTPRGSYIETERGTYSISECAEVICLTPDVIRRLPERAPDGALPDGFIATIDKGDIRKAWYAQPTERYAHCVLGDCIEGGSLVVELSDGSTREIVLPDNQVFEDITPRLFDFYKDGKNEIVTIRSSKTGGAAVVIYALGNEGLIEVAASAENGRANRWLNIVGILTRDYLNPAFFSAKKPFNEFQVLFVRTPHINGRLSRLSLEGGKVIEENDVRNGFSNHVIGSRVLNMYAHLPTKDGGEGYVPSQDRTNLIALTGRFDDVQLPGKVDKAIIATGNYLVTATEDGRLLVIKAQ